MASINYATREISCKVVFYGPGLSGKTTNLQIIHRKIPDKDKSEMVSLATETDRTLFFDFLPLDLGTIKGFSTKFQLYTVPGQVYYNATRKLVLRGVDGVVFVVDSQMDKMPENLESFANLLENLREYGHSVESIPMVLQYNKRDLPNVYPVDQLNALFNKHNLPAYEAVAATGVGVFTTLKAIGKLVIDRFNAKYAGFQGGSRRMQPGQTAQAPRPAAAPPPQAPRPLTPASPFPGPGNPGPNHPGMGFPQPQPGRPAPIPPSNNPFMGAPPQSGSTFQNPGQGASQPPFMIPTPFQAPPAQPAPSGFSGTPPFPGAGNPFAPPPAPGPMGARGPTPGYPPPGPSMPPAGSAPTGFNQPFSSPFGSPSNTPQRPGYPPAGPAQGPGGSNIPVSSFVDSFNAPRPPAGAPIAPPPGLEGPSQFGFPAHPPTQGSPFAGFGNVPPTAPTYPGAVRSPFPENPPPADPQPPASGTGSGGLKGSFSDNSGIISTYEDVQRDENFKTRKLPLPGEKKKGFFDGLFRKDK